ncbi:MAG: endolytic transglycosylase MltG [Hyphomonas sp.]|uniref:endolytic transglycosylase MltG n=1 Tax=Hyphomonas sp. TaxID=87 RepID=UPI0035275AD1
MKILKGLLSLVLLAVILGGAAAGGGWLWMQNELAKAGPLEEDVTFTVKPGESLAGVASRLEADGIIRDAKLMRLKAKLDGTELAIKTGEFEITHQASLADVLEILVEGKAVLHKITLPEGRTTDQLLKIIEADPVLTGEMPTEEIAEGSLLPDTYLFNRGMTRVQLIAKMQSAQEALIDELWARRDPEIPVKTPYEAIILASVVEKETGKVEEQPEIAALFTTRLKKGMRLESDPTIIYGISKGEPLYNAQGQRRTLRRSEIDRKTDWNTYQIDGLPKTPICNPGRGAIAAVLNPPHTEYIFFVADGKGGHLFAKTLKEHNQNVAAYRAYERKEIARERAGE